MAETNEGLALPATAARLRHVAADLRLNPAAFVRAFALAGLYPDRAAWARMLPRLLLALGTALVVAGIALFFAYNWAGLHRSAKFALIEAGILAAAAAAWGFKLDTLPGRAALFAAAFLTGTLLAVYGQVYQTGADPYNLFLAWLALIAGWVLIGRQPGLWLLAAVLANLALILYWGQVLHPPAGGLDELAQIFGPLFALAFAFTDFRLAQWVFGLNAAFLAAWEYAALRGAAWTTGRWSPRLLAVFALIPIVIATLIVIFASGVKEARHLQFTAPLLFTAFTAAALWYYRTRARDLFMLAACLLGAIVLVTALVARATTAGSDAFLLLAALIVGQTAGAAAWLRQVARAWRTP